MGCGQCLTNLTRVLLIVFNFIFWVSGGSILGIGIWILVDPNITSYLTIIQVDGDVQQMKTAAYIFIAFGAFVFAAGFFGCCGAIRNSQCLLGFYILFLVLVFAAEVTAGVIVALNSREINNKIEAEMKRKIKYEYNSSPNQSKMGQFIDKVQKQLGCCGGTGPDDYFNSKWTNETNHVLPKSCCVMHADDKDKPVDQTKCQAKLGAYTSRGCKAKLIEWMSNHNAIILGAGFGIAGLQIIGVVLAIFLCRVIRMEQKY